MLRHAVEQLHKERDLRIFAITSPTVGDGKTTTSINLAGALAQAPDTRVLLIDMDIRRGQVRHDLSLPETRQGGLTEAILDDRSLREVVRRCGDFNLFVVPAGRCPATPYEVLKSARLGELLKDTRAEYDYVILDTAPLLPVPDTRIIAKWVDGFFMVVAAHRTRRRLVEEAFDMIDPPKMLGLIFNGDDSPSSAYSSYSYGLYSLEQSTNGHRSRRWPWAGRSAGRVGSRAS